MNSTIHPVIVVKFDLYCEIGWSLAKKMLLLSAGRRLCLRPVVRQCGSESGGAARTHGTGRPGGFAVCGSTAVAPRELARQPAGLVPRTVRGAGGPPCGGWAQGHPAPGRQYQARTFLF
jgi:hypothetical protein